MAISISNAETQAAKIIAEGEAEYMRILSKHLTILKRQISIPLSDLWMLQDPPKGKDKTLILSSDSPIAEIFYQID